MKEQTYRTPANEALAEISEAPNPRRRNPSALPVGPASLVLLLTNTVEWIVRHEREGADNEMCQAHRLVVQDVYRRMSSSERFRVHCALHARVGHVPTWMQDIDA